jgi:hypothetical protein
VTEMESETTRAIGAFMRSMEEARAMASAGNVGDEIDDVLRHAKDLLDIVDEELLRLDRRKHRRVFETSLTLRRKFERLRDEVRGGLSP